MLLIIVNVSLSNWTGSSVSFSSDTSPKRGYIAVFASEAGDTGRIGGGLYRPTGFEGLGSSPPGQYICHFYVNVSPLCLPVCIMRGRGVERWRVFRLGGDLRGVVTGGGGGHI